MQLVSNDLAVPITQRPDFPDSLSGNSQRRHIQPGTMETDLLGNHLTELATHLLRCPYQLRTPPHEPPRQLGSLISVR